MFNFGKVQFLHFFSFAVLLVSYLWRLCLLRDHEDLILGFLLSYIVWALIYKFIIHFELAWVGLKEGIQHHLYVICSWPSIICWMDDEINFCLFFLLYQLHSFLTQGHWKLMNKVLAHNMSTSVLNRAYYAFISLYMHKETLKRYSKHSFNAEEMK